jgi:hypothetical protein
MENDPVKWFIPENHQHQCRREKKQPEIQRMKAG